MSKQVLINNEWIERDPKAGEFYREEIETAEGSMYIEQYYIEEEADIETLKAARIAEIKQEAEERITRLNWRLQRAQERALLNMTDVETVEDVMKLREAIRTASNDAELAVDKLDNIEAVKNYIWQT